MTATPAPTAYLVDDHALVREGVRLILQAAGWQVVGETGLAAQALQDLPRLRPQVLVLDLHLGLHPGGAAGSGWSVLEALRAPGDPGASSAACSAASPRPRVLVLTMSAQPHDVARALRLGADGYLLKGADGRALVQAVQAVAAGTRVLDPEVAGLLRADGAPLDDPMHERLSPREQAVLRRVVAGATSAAIAAELSLSPKTVDTYRSRLMTKLEADDLPTLVLMALRAGWIDAQGEPGPGA